MCAADETHAQLQRVYFSEGERCQSKSTDCDGLAAGDGVFMGAHVRSQPISPESERQEQTAGGPA